ncbi:uncharacterized protein LOC113549388 [Rhopalosiphum maidis]|uniref:uncharacterized protein LOC113549388 n=1 Tax=Rhopalosiphum maidis TaxID=43146 RepID=UPI000EFF3566|nr:uncharacterized protein LOC113549388 [Rhopalosiphum maidis]
MYHNMIQAVVFLISITVVASINVGTALYNHVDILTYDTQWSKKDMLMLHSRMLIENLIPKNVIDGNTFLGYTKLIIKTSETIANDQTRRIAMISVADAIGGYLHGVMLPRVNQEYYKGHESYKVTNELHALLRKIKFILDTDGRGWMTPVDTGRSITTTADEDDDLIDEETDNPCAALLLSGVPSDDGRPAAVPMPAFDDNLNPGSLAFPFTVGKRLFAVDRPWTASDDRRPLLVRYYRLAAGCTSSAPDQFRADLNRWLDEVVVPLLANRRRWYPVLAGASRVVLAAAKAASNGTAPVDGRPKCGAAARTTTTAAASTNDNGDDMMRRSCDDGPDSRVPNSNVPLAVILVSLVLVWIVYACVFGKKQQSQTFTV